MFFTTLIRHPHSPKRQRRRGASAVEFALVAPVFFLVVFALIEFSRILWVQQALTNAAREGSRKALLATTLSTSDVDDAVRSHLRGTLSNTFDKQKVRVLVTPSDLAGLSSGEPITTTVAVYFKDFSLVPPRYLSDIAVAGSAIVERE